MREDRGADGDVATGTPGAAPGVAGGTAAGSGRTGAHLGAGLGARRGLSIRALAAAAGLTSSRVHQPGICRRITRRSTVRSALVRVGS